MTPLYQQILQVLRRYLSAMNAEGTLIRAIREAGLKAEELAQSDMPQLLPMLERRVRLYVDPVRHARLWADLTAIVGGGDRPSRRARTVQIRTEADISDARMMAKAICEGAGARSFIVHKVATIVSELARNIVHYTPGGVIELSVVRDKPARFIIIASDDGPGIPNIDEILEGRYRSKTGLGRGLIGVKRLSDRFHINPGPPGTRIELEVNL